MDRIAQRIFPFLWFDHQATAVHDPERWASLLQLKKLDIPALEKARTQQ